MQTLADWAVRHNVTPAALADLYRMLGLDSPSVVPPPPSAPSNEASVQAAVVLQAAKQGVRLWRNNSGAFKDETGRLVRYGLANTGAQINSVIKSSDLIGITPITCPCGKRYGVFTAFECKSPGWKFRPSDKRAVAQFAFGKLVLSLGGSFKFITKLEDL